MMKRIALSAAFACLAFASVGHAQLSTYSQNFEGLAIDDPDALDTDGWLVFGLVYDFDGGGTLPPRFTYGPFPAPNGGPGFSAIATGGAGPGQGTQYLNAYSDYNCCNPMDPTQGHFDPTTPFDRVQSIVFQEQPIAASDIGSIWSFSFDGRNATNDLGEPIGCDTEGTSACNAFIKTIDLNTGFQTNLVTFDAKTLGSAEWSRQSIEIDLSDPLLEGQVLQFGFESYSEQFGNTGVYYDNIVFAPAGALSCDFTGDGACNIDDADELTMAVSVMSTDLVYDLNGDNLVNSADIGEWLVQAGADPSNLSATGGNPFLSGDANLDGVVDGQDFVIWNSNKFSSTGNYSQADFNGDGLTDGQDFVTWNTNKFQSSQGGFAVPEPSVPALLLIGLLGLRIRRRPAA